MDQNNNQIFTLEEASNPQQIHLTDYFNIIRRRKWLVIIFILVVVSIVTVKSLNVTPVYKATTQIIIERQSTNIKDEGVLPINISEDEYYKTQYNLLRSRSLIYKVIEDLQLREYFASKNKINKPNLLDSAFNRIRDFLITTTNGVRNFIGSFSSGSRTENSKVSNVPSRKDIEHVKNEDPLVNWYLSKLEIKPVSDSRLIDITFKETSAEMAALIANAHARAFIDKNYKEQLAAAQQTLNWLKTQLEEQRSKVVSSKKIFHEYMNQQKLESTEGRQNIVFQKLLELNTVLTKAKMDRIASQIVYDQLEGFSIDSIDNESLFSLPEITKDPVIRGLRNQWVKLKLERQRLNAEYKIKLPDHSQLDYEINQIEKEITSEVQRSRKTIKAELDRAIAFEKSVQDALNEQKQLSLSFSEKSIKPDVLNREAESNQDIYNLLLERFKVVDLTSAFKYHNIQIVDQAEVPRSPENPKTLFKIFLSFLLSTFMGSGIALFFEYMDKSVKAPEDVMQRLGMPVLSTVPHDKSLERSDTKVLPYLKSCSEQGKYIESYASYDYSNQFIGLQLRRQGKPGLVVLIESTSAGEGKTTLLAKSAMDLSRSGLRVLMVDGDQHRPALHQVFGINERTNGLTTAMNNILSQEINAGTLSEYSVDDLFFLIGLKKKSGQLIISNNSHNTIAAFKNGHLIQIHGKNNPLSNRLGTILLRGGFIKKNQIEDALERNQRTGQPLGYILINSGYLTRDQLQGPLRLQTEENLQKVFSWKRGTFVFEHGDMEMYEDERIFFGEDYDPIIRHLGRMAGSRLLESTALSYVMSDLKPNLSLLPSGETPAFTERYNTAHLTLLEKFLDIFKQRFDIVLVDAPPILASEGAIPMAKLADGVIMVVKAGYMPVKAINEATTRLKQANINILGIILNHVKTERGFYPTY